MKRLIKAFLMAAIAPSFLWASNMTMDGPMTDANAALGQAYQKRFNLNTDDHNIDYVSAQVVYSSGTYAQGTFGDGTASSATITVVNATALSSATATSTVYVSSYSALVNQTVFLGGTNVAVRVGASNGATACNISDDIVTQAVFTSTCSFANASLTVTAPRYGTAYNTYSIRSSSITAISSATFSGGLDNATLCINGTCLQANKHWYPKATTAATADSLYAAINSSFSIVTSSDIGATSVIYATSTAVGTGTNYLLSSSSQAALTIGGAAPVVASNGSATGAMIGGTAASYALRGQNITIANHGYPVALKVSISSTTGNQALTYSTASVGGTNVTLATGSTWYTIPIDANTIQLSQTSTGAVAGLAVTLTSSRTLTTADAWAVNIATTSGNTSYGWYESDDGVNFWLAPGTSTTTITSGDAFIYPSTFTFVDFGNITAKWLQLNVAAPATAGAIKVNAYIHGEKR